MIRADDELQTKTQNDLYDVAACHACFWCVGLVCFVFFNSAHKIDANEWRVNKSLDAQSNGISRGCLLFLGECSWTPVGLHMLKRNNVLSKWNVALNIVSWSSAPSFTILQPSHPPLQWGMYNHGLHLCLIMATDGSVTGFLSSHHCSHSFPPFGYCQHTFTSNYVSCPRLFILLIPPHAIQMIHMQLCFYGHSCHYRLSTSGVWALL